MHIKVDFVLLHVFNNACLSMAQQPLVGKGFLIVQTSQRHQDTPHSVGLQWTSDHPEAETSN